jgi:hypothetical protein
MRRKHGVQIVFPITYLMNEFLVVLLAYGLFVFLLIRMLKDARNVKHFFSMAFPVHSGPSRVKHVVVTWNFGDISTFENHLRNI